jgi:hypothetical protein
MQGLIKILGTTPISACIEKDKIEQLTALAETFALCFDLSEGSPQLPPILLSIL